MKKNRILAALALLLLLGTACKAGEPAAQADTVPAEAAALEKTVGAQQGPPVLSAPRKAETPDAGAEEPFPEGTHTPQALPAPVVTPVLSAEQMPGDYNGLELPVQGATGYASTYLPMWRDPSDSDAAQQAIAEWTERERKRQSELALQKAQEQAARAAEQARVAAGQAAAQQAAGTADPPAQAVPDGGAAEGSAGSGTTPSDAAPAGPDAAAAPESAPPAQTTAPADGAVTPTAVSLPPAATATGPAQEAAAPGAPTQAAPAPESAPEPPADPKPSATAGVMAILPAGTDFTVLEEQGKWWKIQCVADYREDGQELHGETIGWVEHRYCLINLPDVIPSILYDATNGYDSRFVSCGKPLPSITGRALYPGAMRNDRLDEKAFMMPVLYAMAPRLCAVQRAALAQGNSLILYEGYRPLETQVEVSRALHALVRQDSEVNAAVNGSPWGIGWFIAAGASNHQYGYAVDVSLARVVSAEERQAGAYRYLRITEYDVYQMPTVMHELSRAAVTFTSPVDSKSATAWKSRQLAPTMTQAAILLQNYCTAAGLTPLASEWWHFNDLAARENVLGNLGRGDFQIKKCRSVPPEA